MLNIKNLFHTFMEEANDNGKDLPAGEDNTEETQDNDAQKIIDEINGEKIDEEVELPSDSKSGDVEKLFAEKYKTIDELKKGISGLKSELPDYVIDGMNDEALEKHYVELRKTFSKKDDNNKDRKFVKEEVKENKDDKPDDKKVEVTGLWKALENDFKTTGTISTEMYDKFEELGIPSDIVDGYADKIHSEQVDFTNKIYEMSGGQEQYAEIKDWAEDGNIPQSELDAIAKMPYDAMLSAMSGIKARFDIANNKNTEEHKKEETRITGDTKKTSSGSYTSQESYMKDVANKKYGQNRAYTEAVDRKFENSKFK